MPAVCDLSLQHKLHKFLCRRGHVLEALAERNDGKAHAFQILHHLHSAPAVESNLPDIKPFTQSLDKLLDVSVISVSTSPRLYALKRAHRAGSSVGQCRILSFSTFFDGVQKYRIRSLPSFSFCFSRPRTAPTPSRESGSPSVAAQTMVQCQETGSR